MAAQPQIVASLLNLSYLASAAHGPAARLVDALAVCLEAWDLDHYLQQPFDCLNPATK